MMTVLPLFSSPVFHNTYELNTSEVELIKNETFKPNTHLDGYVSDDKDILSKYPNLSNIAHKHIQYSLYNQDCFSIVSDIKYKVLSSWVNKHPPKHSAHRHTHKNCMFTGVLYVDIPDNSGRLIFDVPMSVPTWTTGTIEPRVSNYTLYNSKGWYLPCKTGMCVLFPSHPQHHVTENESNHDRYTIAFNIVLEGNMNSENMQPLNVNINV